MSEPSSRPNVASQGGPSVTEDAFLGGRLTCRQPARGYRAGIDAVLLAASIPAQPGQRSAELGSGAGIAALCLAHRVNGLSVRGLELQADLVALASANAQANALADCVEFVAGDVLAPMADLRSRGFAPDAFDHVYVNPPFYDADKAALPPDPGKASAHALRSGSLTDWVRIACTLARAGGTVTFVHRTSAVPDLVTALGRWTGGLRLFPLWPRAEEPAGRILIQGIKGSRAPFELRAGLVLHDAAHAFTPQAEDILRHGAALCLD